MALDVDELEARARAVLDPAVADFFAAGSGDEVSVGEARAAWDAWRFRPHVLTDVSECDTSCELLGTRLESPILVAPTAYHALASDEAELASAAGADDAGALYVMATRATRPIEAIAAALGRPWWFQVYVLRDRGLTRALVERAVAAGASALVLTGDTPIVGPKPRTGGAIPLGAADHLVNLRPHLGDLDEAAVRHATSQDPGLDGRVIGWLAELSGLPVIVKGVCRSDDARRLIDEGASGLVVSNHGGRQLDGAIATAEALPEVVGAAGEVPVLVDGGLRDGRGILKALCLGARGVMLGRPVLWALAVGGRALVAELLETLRSELAEAMSLAGVARLEGCEPSLLARRPDC